MDSLVYKRRCKIGPLPPEPIFQVNMQFSNNSIPNYQDNSMTKTQKNKDKLTARMKFLRNSSRKLIKELSIHKMLNERIDSYTSEYFQYVEKLHNFEEASMIMHKAAILLQKNIRGFLTRKSFFEVFIANSKKSCLAHVESLKLCSDFCFYYIGRKPKISAIIIQRAFRRRIFYKKIQRINRVYLLLKAAKEEKAETLLREFISCFACTLKIENEKIIQIRNAKLYIIKRKLAILKIKQVVKREKINVRLLKLKIRKYKRRFTSQGAIHKPKLKKLLTMGSPDRKFSEINEQDSNEEDKASKTEELLALVAARDLAEKLAEEKREKISLAKISYNIKRGKLKFFRKLKLSATESTQISADTIHSKQIHLSPMKLAAKSLSLQAKTLKPIQKIRSNDSSPNYSKLNYLKATACSELYKNKPVQEEVRKEVESHGNLVFRFRGRVLLPTIASRKKNQHKVSIERISPKWNINPRVREEYIGSINNEGFVNCEAVKYSRTPSPSFLQPKGIFQRRNNRSGNGGCLRVLKFSVNRILPEFIEENSRFSGEIKPTLKLNMHKFQGFAKFHRSFREDF